MKTLILFSLFMCGILITFSNGVELENPDLNFYFFKSFDSPLYSSDFYEPYETYGNSYSSDENNESSDSSVENNDENDSRNKAVANEGDGTEIVYANENSSSSEDDKNEEEDSVENNLKKQPFVKRIKYVDPDQKKFKESGDYVSPDDVAFRLSRQKRSKKPKMEENEEDEEGEEELDDYTQSYNDFVRTHFQKHDENEETDEDDYTDGSTEATAAQAASVEENDENDDSNEESDYVDDSDYQRVKKLSAGGGEERKPNSQYCKIIFKDDQECTVCKNPKTHDTSESCSYSSSPAPKRYAFKRQKNYNSRDNDDKDKDNDDDNENEKNQTPSYEDSVEDEEPKRKKPQNKKSKGRKTKKAEDYNPVEEKLRTYTNPNYYGNYYNNDRHTNSPLHSQTLSEYDDDLSFKASEPYAAGTSSDGNVDKVLESFKNRDWSKCKHKREKGITCYYCKDEDGTTQEECMYSSDFDNEEPNINTKKINSDFKFENKSEITTSIPILGKDISIYKNPSTIMTTFNNNQQQRKLNRDQNFKVYPNSNNYKDYQNSDSHLSNYEQNRRSFDIDAPITTLEYIEPKHKKTLKRMVTSKVHKDYEHEDPIINKSLFYSKVIHGYA